VKQGTLVLAVASVAGLGAVAGTIWVGSSVREETVVSNPYEEGLRQDADRRARAALGWDVRLEAPPAAPGPVALAFEVVDREGKPLEGADVLVWLSRPETSRGAVTRAARPAGLGRYTVDLDLAAPGAWLLRFEVRRRAERVQLEKTLTVGGATSAPRAPCAPSTAPCVAPLSGGGEVALALGPDPLRTMTDLSAAVELRGLPAEGARVTLSFAMPGMDMGPNVRTLERAAPGRFEGQAVLVRCPSGGKGWVAEVSVTPSGAPARTARFAFTVSE
jgi:nitrogen fixation protein FixH